MLGRLVKEIIQSRGINYPMTPIAPLMKRGDLTMVNLECAITSHQEWWHGNPKAFYFGAPPEASSILRDCGVHLVSLANNHILDFDIAGLRDTLRYLEKENIIFAGAGENKKQAYSPVCIDVNTLKFGMVAFCDHQADFAAQDNTPGMAYLDLNDEDNTLKQFQESLSIMQKQGVVMPILSLHWGPNMVLRPSKKFVCLARAAIDMGYKILFGHSAHVFHGIEIYRGCPILYASGDLVDDYYVDPEFRNDHQLLFELEFSDTTLQRILLYPVFIEEFQTKPANETQFQFIQNRMTELCREMGTKIERLNLHSLVIQISHID